MTLFVAPLCEFRGSVSDEASGTAIGCHAWHGVEYDSGSRSLDVDTDIARIDINAINDDDDINQTGEAIPMSSITIRNLDPAVKERLRVRAAEHGHSMEAAARRILQTTLKGSVRPPALNLYERIRARFAPLGGADDLEIPPREPGRDPPRFE